MDWHISSIIHLLKRILAYAISALIATTIVFFFLHYIPGDPFSRFLLEMTKTYNTGYGQEGMGYYIDMWKEKFGLNKDILTQYAMYLYQVFWMHDLGLSFINYPYSVSVQINYYLPWSIVLLGIALIISWIIGLIAGVCLGWVRGSKTDSSAFTFAVIFSQIPYYLLAIFIVLVFGYMLKLFPTGGSYSYNIEPSLSLAFLIDAIYHAFLPALSIILVSICGQLIHTRSLTIIILGEDYLKFAQSKGLSTIRILNRYVLRNILLSKVTQLAMSLGFTVNGFLLVEWIFRYPGIGSLLVDAINKLDYNTIQGIILVSIFTVIAANFIADTIYPLLDPRVRRE